MPDDVTRRTGDAGLDAAAVLADPVRRSLLGFAADSPNPVGRDEAAAAVGIGRSLAGYHLDQLVDEGLLEVTYARRNGRAGPGAGRPAKLYHRTPVEVTVQLPARDDALVAHLLASAVEADPSGTARDALRDVTRAAGRAIGRATPTGDVGALVEALAERGYAPIEAEGEIRLRNCPFHHLVGDHLDLVCALNHDLLGAAAGAANVPFQAHLDPQPGHCCVVLRRPSGPRSRARRRA